MATGETNSQTHPAAASRQTLLAEIVGLMGGAGDGSEVLARRVSRRHEAAAPVSRGDTTLTMVAPPSGGRGVRQSEHWHSLTSIRAWDRPRCSASANAVS